MDANTADHQALLREMYIPLEDNQTRLLRIHPSVSWTAEIICDLVVVTLHKKGGVVLPGESQWTQYDTLSYTWGGSEAPDSIQLHGLAFPVSRNLHNALAHIRQSKKETLLWVDACCINQESLAEKAKQVGMMSQIYHKAARTIVWLGLPTESDDKVFGLIRTIDDMGLYDRGQACKSAETRKAATTLVETRRWFTRTWVRQEVHMAKKVTIMCGAHSCEFEQFETVMDELMPEVADPMNSYNPELDLSKTIHRAKQLFAWFKRDCDTYHYPEGQMQDMWFHIIMRGTLYDSSLPQDKVYAALGIVAAMTKRGEPQYADVADSTEGFPAIDYNKSPSVVYQEFIKHAINTSRSLRSLSVFQDRENGSGEDLPSWGIDLRRNVPRYQIPLEMFSFGHYGEEPMRQVYSDTGRLCLGGVRVGTVSSIDSPWVDGLRREVMGKFKSAGLESCFSTNGRWFAKEGSKGVEETLGILEKKCGYVWTQVEPEAGRLYSDVGEDGFEDFDPTRHRCFAFVSNQVWEGDTLVHLFGADVPYVLRYVDGDQYQFVGPALLVVGRVQTGKAGDVFRYSAADHGYDGEGEQFVLI